MNQSKKIIIIGNEKISENKNGFYCDNVDMKTIPEELNKNFDIVFIARKSKVERSHILDLNKIQTASNIFSFLYNIFKTFKHKETKYFLVSITPFTFFAYSILFFFRKETFIYLRSNGYEEYRAIFGFIGPLIYHFMYIFITYKSKIISCQERLVKKKKSYLVFPSELNSDWLNNRTKPLLDKPRLLYVGRLKIEKGIFSLLKICDEISSEVELSIVGRIEDKKIESQKVQLLGYGFNAKTLCKIYDNHNILILPSFTEAHPKVIDESLSRLRPVIIFEEINHIIQNRKGIFVSKRNTKSFLETIKFIMNDYIKIQESIATNKLPAKIELVSEIKNILK